MNIAVGAVISMVLLFLIHNATTTNIECIIQQFSDMRRNDIMKEGITFQRIKVGCNFIADDVLKFNTKHIMIAFNKTDGQGTLKIMYKLKLIVMYPITGQKV